MLTTLILLAALAAHEPVALDRIGIDQARALDGRRVVTSFVVSTPPYTFAGATVVGCFELPDGVSRTAVLAGRRLGDVDMGKRVEVRGVLRVIDHAAAVVNGVLVPAWVEVRIEAS